ncbi:MAG: hypothetical protein AB7I59_13405 [Geminicoccaceae bacterium]
MLYPWLDWQRAGLEAWLATARLATTVTPLAPVLDPPHELLARTLAAGAVASRPVEAAVERDAPFPVAAEELLRTPFLRLVRLRGRAADRRFVMVAPNSGYAAAIASPLITALLALGEVVVTDWTDARLVPLAAGPFGLASQIATAIEAAAAVAGPAHLVALSQSGPAVLAAAAILAAGPERLRPASLAFLGCQLAPETNRTPLQRMLAGLPRDVLAHGLTSAVGVGQPGAGRRVYPALLQLLAYSVASPGLYGEIQLGLLQEIAAGRSGDYDRQHLDLHSLLDVPAELFLDMLDWATTGSLGTSGTLILAGERHALARLRGTPILTLEAGEDGLVGTGQTHALGSLLPESRAETLAGAQHHELFTGPSFVGAVPAVLRRFYLSSR